MLVDFHIVVKVMGFLEGEFFMIPHGDNLLPFSASYLQFSPGRRQHALSHRQHLMLSLRLSSYPRPQAELTQCDSQSTRINENRTIPRVA